MNRDRAAPGRAFNDTQAGNAPSSGNWQKCVGNYGPAQTIDAAGLSRRPSAKAQQAANRLGSGQVQPVSPIFTRSGIPIYPHRDGIESQLPGH